MWDIYIPRPDLAIIHCPEHTLCIQLPDFSVLSPWDHVLVEPPTWYLPGLLHDNPSGREARFQFTELVHDPSASDRFNLYIMHTTESRSGMGIVAGTIVPPTAPPAVSSSQPRPVPNPPTLEKRVRTRLLLDVPPDRKGWELVGESRWNGFRSQMYRVEHGFELRASSYEDMVSGGEMGML
jgi:hypothetical protein